MNLARFFLWMVASVVGVVAGFALGFAASGLTSAVFPHCGIPCDDTWPEFLAAAAAYGVWFVVAIGTSILAWRFLAHR